jgi:hypothetical protein
VAFWVYILRCADHSYYTGHTDNLEKRIMEHQTGEIEGYTSIRLLESEEKGSNDEGGLGRSLSFGACKMPFDELRANGRPG